MTLSLVALATGCGFRAATPEERAIPLGITEAAPATGESQSDAATDFSAATPAQSTATDDFDGSTVEIGGPTDEMSYIEPPPAASAPITSQPIPAYLLDDAISLYLDVLLLDLLLPPPTVPSASPGGFTNLELLCRDQGIPDSVCRRRYGR